jgi:hypothetical protein
MLMEAVLLGTGFAPFLHTEFGGEESISLVKPVTG